MKILWLSTVRSAAMGVFCLLSLSTAMAAPEVRNTITRTMPILVIETRTHGSTERRERYERNARLSCCRVGMTLPVEYRDTEQMLEAEQPPQLPRPTRYQQWIRVNNQYILLNVLTNTVIKVVVVNP